MSVDSPSDRTINSIGDHTSTNSNQTSLSAHQSNSDSHCIQYISGCQAIGSRTLLFDNNTNMALNFSNHDLLHQNHPTLHHHNNTSDDGLLDVKHHLTNTLELDSGLMQSAAANMNMWKSTMSLGHGFLPGADMGSFAASWPTHSSNHLGHQAATAQQTMSHQHIIGYQQHHPSPSHQRSMSHLPTNNQELMGATLKSQAEQATFMLNSINNQVNVSQDSTSSSNNLHPQSSHHQTSTTVTPSNDNMNLRTTVQSVDHNVASYNLALNDNHQFYNLNSRTDSNRSHTGSIKPPVFLTDRSIPMSLSSHHHNNHQHNHQASQITSYHGNSLNDNQTAASSHHITGSISAASNGNSSRNVGSFRCLHCGEMFSMRNVYQSHLKTHSNEKGPKAKFHCEQCGHSFSQKTSLNRHMKSHTGERPFPCEICGKAFSEKERLKIHMRTHTGEKPFSCSICGKSFSQKSTVKRHQTVHTGEKKFKCDCGKGFANRGNLIAHIKTRGANHFE